MAGLKEAVLSADKDGDEESLEKAMLALADFTLTHTVISFTERNGESEMVLGTGVFYLEGQYRRAAEEALDRARTEAAKAGNAGFGNAYGKVMDICDARARRYGWGYTAPYFNCIANELSGFPEGEVVSDQLTANIPPAALYRVSFVSPLVSWEPVTPVMLAIIALGILLAIRILVFTISRLGAKLLK